MSLNSIKDPSEEQRIVEQLLEINEHEISAGMLNALTKSIYFVWKLNYTNPFNEEILKLNNINLAYPLIFKRFDDILDIQNTDTDIQKSDLKAKKHFVAYVYFSIYQALNLQNKQLSDFENNEEIKSILNIAIKFHYSYLKYYHEIEYKVSLFENSSLVIIRTIEILLHIEAKRQEVSSLHLKEKYFSTNDDLELLFSNMINNDEIENTYYVIKSATNKKKNFIVYDNPIYDIYIQIESCRPTKKGEQKGESVKNTNIIHHLQNGFIAYKKLLLLNKKSSLATYKRSNSSTYPLQETEEEELLKNTQPLHIGDHGPLCHEDTIDANNKAKRTYRPVPNKNSKHNIPNIYKQKLRNTAFSSHITKNSLMLNSNYKTPPLPIFKNFLKEMFLEKDSNRNLLYDIIFLIDTLLGIGYYMIIQLIDKKNNTVSYKKPYINVKLDQSPFAKNSNLFLSNENSQTVKFYIPEKFDLLLYNAHTLIKQKVEINFLSIEEANKYFQYIRHMMNDYSRKISFNPKEMWKLISTYMKNDYDTELMTHFFCIGKYRRNDTSKLSYASTPKYSQKHNKVLEVYYDQLNYNEIISKLLELEYIKTAPSSEFSETFELVGSRMAVDKQKSRDFFSIIKKELLFNQKNPITHFNLLAIYTRYALSFLILTRPYEFSASLSRYSKIKEVLIISEKSTSLLSGIRIMPLCQQAIEIIEEYQHHCKQMKILDDNIYIINDHKPQVCSAGSMKKFCNTSYTNAFIEDFITHVPLNTGRHVFTKEAILFSLNPTYIETAMGHYSLGQEQTGIYSSMNIPEYSSEIKNFIANISKDYGI